MVVTSLAPADVERPVQPPAASGRRWRRRSRLWDGIFALGLLSVGFAWSGSVHLYTFNLALLAVFGAVALNLLMGTAGQVSVGNSAFMAVGAYTAVFAIRSGVPFPLDLVVGTVSGAVAGAIIGLPALRLRGLHLALATLAGLFIVLYGATEYQARSGPNTTSGFYLDPLFLSKGLDGSQVYWVVTLFVLVAVLLAGARALSSHRAGRAWRMIRDHEIVAPTLGIPVTRYKMYAFVISSAVIGFQGALLAHFFGSVSAETYTFELAVAYVAMVLIGGIDSLAGAVVGAGIVTALPVITPRIVNVFLGEERALSMGPAIGTILYGLLVIVFVTSSPHGIVGLVEDAKRRVRCSSRVARRFETTEEVNQQTSRGDMS